MREKRSDLKVLSLFYLSLERTQFLDDGHEVHKTNFDKSSGAMKGRKQLIRRISVI
jgi:hypothetical protein